MTENIEEVEDEIDGDGSSDIKMKVTFKNAILLQCHQCMGFYSEGKIDCEVTNCSLYPFMPYRQKEPDLTIYSYNPRKRGMVKLTPPDPAKQEAAKLRFAKKEE